MSNSCLCAYVSWLLENDVSGQCISLMDMGTFSCIIIHSTWITVHIPSSALLMDWKTQRTVPSAHRASHMLSPHPSPSAFFLQFCPLSLSMPPSLVLCGSPKWPQVHVGGYGGSCQKLKWCLYGLTFNAPPVSPSAVIGKPLSSLLWSIALRSWLLPPSDESLTKTS